MFKLVMLTLAFTLLLSGVLCVDPTMRIYVEFQGPCRENGSFDCSGGGRLRPVVVHGLAADNDQQAHIVLANVTDQVQVNQEEESLVDSNDASSHQGGGAVGSQRVQSAVSPHVDLQGNFIVLISSFLCNF